MLNVRFGEQSQVERAIRRDFAASPRKSRPVRNVTRWMEQESDWVLVQKKE